MGHLDLQHQTISHTSVKRVNTQIPVPNVHTLFAAPHVNTSSAISPVAKTDSTARDGSIADGITLVAFVTSFSVHNTEHKHSQMARNHNTWQDTDKIALNTCARVAVGGDVAFIEQHNRRESWWRHLLLPQTHIGVNKGKVIFAEDRKHVFIHRHQLSMGSGNNISKNTIWCSLVTRSNISNNTVLHNTYRVVKDFDVLVDWSCTCQTGLLLQINMRQNIRVVFRRRDQRTSDIQRRQLSLNVSRNIEPINVFKNRPELMMLRVKRMTNW